MGSFTIFVPQSFLDSLSFTIIPSQLLFTILPSESFFHNLPFTIFLSQPFTIFPSQSFFHYLSQFYFHNLFFTVFLSQSLFPIFARFGTHRCTLGYLFIGWSKLGAPLVKRQRRMVTSLSYKIDMHLVLKAFLY